MEIQKSYRALQKQENRLPINQILMQLQNKVNKTKVVALQILINSYFTLKCKSETAESNWSSKLATFGYKSCKI